MSRRLPPLYALRAFEAAARHASFTRAAEELVLTQSAVSRHIRTLEEHFACRLFERRGRSLQLTEPARALLPGLSDGFDALERACGALQADAGVLRLKAPTTLTVRWLLSRLSRFRTLEPDNEVQLTSAWMDVDRVNFQQEPFDCAVLLAGGEFPSDWDSVLLFAEWLIPVCAADALQQGPWSLARLRAAEQLHPTPDRRDWLRWLQATGLERQVPLKTGQLFDMLELGIVAAARGYGVSIGDWLLVAEDVNAGHLGLPWPTAVASGDGYYLVWPKAQRPAVLRRVQRLRDFLLEEVAHMRLPSVELCGQTR